MTSAIRILLIDDNTVDADILRHNLEEIKNFPFQLEWEAEVSRGLSRILEARQDVYLIDLNLGGTTGLDLIRAASQAGCKAPLILYTGIEKADIGVQAAAAGAADYLVKDRMDPFLLEKTIRGALERHRLLAENQIMEQKLFESERLESLGQMACGIAHDFNNVLSVIMATAEIAAKGISAASETGRNLRGILTATQRAADLTEQMLAFGQRGRFQVKPLDLMALAANTAEFSRVIIPRGIAIKMDFPGTLPGAFAGTLPNVLGDETQIRQVVLNLIRNAVDAMSGVGAITMTGRLRAGMNEAERNRYTPPLSDGEFVQIAVTDTGKGMTPELTRKIFEAFFTTKPKGRGLGLASVMRILKSHGGGISVDSQMGKGTTMTISLPSAAQTQPIGSSEGESATASGYSLKSVRLLVVDDDVQFLETLGRALESRHILVTTLHRGDLAAEEFTKGMIDYTALISDVNLYDMTGLELARRLRVSHPDFPVILMSGLDETEEVARECEQGTLQFLRKPFSMQSLMDALDAALAKRQPAAALTFQRL